MRKVFQRGAVPDKIRYRFKSRLFMIKQRAGEVAKTLRETEGLTTAQAMNTRREMGFVNASIRECDRYISLPSTVAPLDLSWLDLPAAPPPEEELGWLDLPAGGGDPELPEPGIDMSWTDLPAGGEGVADEPVPVSLPGVHCPVCGDPEDAQPVACPRCAVRYHKECWEYAGGCAIYGCR